MAPTAERFVDVAFRKTGLYSLPYTQKKAKWLIRNHVLSLFADFPTLKPSVDPFTYEDGTTVYLLKASGDLCLSSLRVHVSVWIHQSYPYLAPFVYLSSPVGEPVVRHPYVDPSTGVVTTHYLLTWVYPRSKLSELVRNLVKIFTFWPPVSPLHPKVHVLPRVTAASLSPSKREAIDRLGLHILHDVEAYRAAAKNNIENTLAVRSKLQERAAVVSSVVAGLQAEKLALEARVDATKSKAEELSNWLKDNDVDSFPENDRVEEAFEGADDGSRLLLEHQAADKGIEGTIKAMDAAMCRGVVPFKTYMKQVRALAWEQFYHRKMNVEAAAGASFLPS